MGNSTSEPREFPRRLLYLCNDYVALLNAYGLQISSSAKGNPYHNAFVESFVNTLKQVEVFKEKRMHLGIDYLTPSELEEETKTDPSLASQFNLQL